MNECVKRPSVCRHCTQSMTADMIDTHISHDCQLAPVICQTVIDRSHVASTQMILGIAYRSSSRP
jgi:hypothetical protein